MTTEITEAKKAPATAPHQWKGKDRFGYDTGDLLRDCARCFLQNGQAVTAGLNYFQDIMENFPAEFQEQLQREVIPLVEKDETQPKHLDEADSYIEQRLDKLGVNFRIEHFFGKSQNKYRRHYEILLAVSLVIRLAERKEEESVKKGYLKFASHVLDETQMGIANDPDLAWVKSRIAEVRKLFNGDGELQEDISPDILKQPFVKTHELATPKQIAA